MAKRGSPPVTAIFLLFGMMVVAGIIRWLLRNDRAAAIEAQTGLFRMRVSPPQDGKRGSRPCAI
jgi:hypothetical protein